MTIEVTKRDIIHMIRGSIPCMAMKERAMEMGVGNDFYAEWEWFDPSHECWSKYTREQLLDLYRLPHK